MFCRLIASFFFIGYFPVAPGTVASVIAMLILLILKPSDLSMSFILLFIFLLGVICSENIEKRCGEKDPPYIVIDEIVGYFTAIFLIEPTPINLFLGFLLFRFFDILKPPPIRLVEKRIKGGFGIMLDDIIAGLITNLLLRIYLMVS